MKIIAFILLPTLLLLGCSPKNTDQDHWVHSFVDANIPHLDPIHSTNAYSSKINASIFEGLYHYHYLKQPIQVEPLLAKNKPKVSPDGLTYTIKIQKGVLFQDDPAFPGGKGRELKAKDFIYSWKRLADPKNKALGWWVFDGLIEGLNSWRDQIRKGQATYDTPVSGLKAVDDYTLKITLNQVSPQLLHFLSMPQTMVVAKEVVEKYGKEIINHPVGTGPFRLKKWVRNSEIQLIKNQTYRPVFYPSEASPKAASMGLLKNAGKKLPLSEGISVKILAERQPLWLAFLKGHIDHGVIPKDNFDQVFENNRIKRDFTDRGIRIHYQHRSDIVYVSFNMEHPILGKNKKIRQAMTYALDQKLIFEKFYKKQGTIAQGPIPPGLDFYDPNYRHPIQYDLEKAKQLLVEAGFPEGKGLPVFDYDMPNISTWSRQFGEFLQAQWKKIGIQINLVSNTWPQFDKKLKTKKVMLFDMAWLADYPDPQSLFQLFYSQNISPGPNNSNFMNRKYDTLYEQSMQLPAGKERTAFYKKMRQILNEEVPSTFIVHRAFLRPYHGWLEGYFESSMIFDAYKYLKVDPQKKKELQKAL